MEQLKTIIEGYKTLQALINEQLTDAETDLHRLRLVNNLQRDMDNISLLFGLGDIGNEHNTGKLLPHAPKPLPAATGGRENLTTAEQLKNAVNQAWHEFPLLTEPDIMRRYNELTIRGVAKKAKMHVTSDQPALSLEFIVDIKAAIQEVTEFHIKANSVQTTNVLKSAEEMPESTSTDESEINAMAEGLAEFHEKQRIEGPGNAIEKLEAEGRIKPSLADQAAQWDKETTKARPAEEEPAQEKTKPSDKKADTVKGKK